MDGVELLTQIKKRRSPSTQVVMVTAYPTDDSRDECVKLGAAGYLTKPISIQELKTVLLLMAGARELKRPSDESAERLVPHARFNPSR